MYIGIYNRYSDYRPLNCPAKIIPSHQTFQIIPGTIPDIAFWEPSFPFRVPIALLKYAYNPPNLCLLTHFWGIIVWYSYVL